MNMRIKKKQLKAKLELENQILDAEIAALKTSAKRKEAKLRQMRAQIRLAESLKEGIVSHTRIKTHSYNSYRGTHPYAVGSDNQVMSGAILKKYYEYVDRGLIKSQSQLNKYETEDWFKNEIMTEDMMKEATDLADKWIGARAEKHQRYMEDLKAGRLYDFGF